MTSGSLSTFADDVLHYNVIRNLLISMTCISDHDLKLNVKKCKSPLLSRKWVPTCNQTVVVDGLPLEKVQSYKYLGVLISSNLAWGNCVSIISAREPRNIGMLLLS